MKPQMMICLWHVQYKYGPVSLSLNKWSCVVFLSNATSLTPTCQCTVTGRRKRAQQWTWRWRNRSLRPPARRRRIPTPPRSQRMGRVLVRSWIFGLFICGLENMLEHVHACLTQHSNLMYWLQILIFIFSIPFYCLFRGIYSPLLPNVEVCACVYFPRNG